MTSIHLEGRVGNRPPSNLRTQAPALVAYVTALEAYQQRRTVEGRAVLFRSYRRWVQTFLDDEGEAERATINFMVALRNQPSQSPEMDAAA